MNTRIDERDLRESFWRGHGLVKTCAYVALCGLYFALPGRAEAEKPCPPVLTGDDGSPIGGGSTCGAKSGDLSETPDYKDPVAGVTLLGGRTVVSVANGSELSEALAKAACGQTIQLAPGSYSGTFKVNLICPANNPLIIRGAANFASTVTDPLVVDGARNIVTGINFSGADARVTLAGVNNKWIGNRLSGWTSSQGINVGNGKAGQREHEVAYNEIGPPGPWSSGQFRWGLRSPTNADESSVATDVWVHHNLFRDFPNTKGNADAMEPGESSYPWAPYFQARWYIEDNIFRGMADCNQATLDMKLGGSVVRRNTITDSCNVKIQSRFGSYTIWESNYVTSGQIMVNGRGHKVVCNVVTGGSGIRVNAGEAEHDFTGKDERGKNPHNRSAEVLVAGNRGPLFVGYQPTDRYSLAAVGTVIEDHEGEIKFGLHSDTVDRRNASASYKCSPANRLDTADVGPDALKGAPGSYREARGL